MNSRQDRIYLSPPRATEEDVAAVVRAMESGWIAPAGPDIRDFEEAVAEYVGVSHAVALSSGTAALHLSLLHLGVQPGDVVIVPTVTFAATAFPVTYLGAEPVFIDVDEHGALSREMLDVALRTLRKSGRRVGAIIPVDLYGTPCNYMELLDVIGDFGAPVIEDAAEALGSRVGDAHAGSFGDAGVLSFNGNKILTTSGGGMLVTDDERLATRVRHSATQAREAVPWYEHESIGYNYRLSNLLAALGRSQMARIEEEVAARRSIREWYRDNFDRIPGVSVQSDPDWGASNAWLSIVRFERSSWPDAPRIVREALEQANIESRPIWKPMHQQPVFRQAQVFLDGSADLMFEEGLCLPSGGSMMREDVDRVSSLVIHTLESL